MSDDKIKAEMPRVPAGPTVEGEEFLRFMRYLGYIDDNVERVVIDAATRDIEVTLGRDPDGTTVIRRHPLWRSE